MTHGPINHSNNLSISINYRFDLSLLVFLFPSLPVYVAGVAWEIERNNSSQVFMLVFVPLLTL